jgi:hypothetical protein
MSTEKKLGDYIKQIGAYGILLTFFAIGLAIAGAFWSSTVSDLNSQIGRVRVELEKTTDELSQVKSDYLTYKTLTEAGENNLNPVKIPIDSSSKDQKVEIKTINTEKSEKFFGGNIIISLIATPFGGDPLRHKVLANISSPNGKVIKIESLDIGNVINYSGNEITILSAETFSASFQVSKN